MIQNSGGRPPGGPFASATAGMAPTLTGPVMPPSGVDPQQFVIVIHGGESLGH
jgi:hypothetical protein